MHVFIARQYVHLIVSGAGGTKKILFYFPFILLLLEFQEDAG
jgi:hypothetical protein